MREDREGREGPDDAPIDGFRVAPRDAEVCETQRNFEPSCSGHVKGSSSEVDFGVLVGVDVWT